MFWKALTKDERREVAALLNSIEENSCWPAQLMFTETLLTPKPKGGDRPISLLALLFRIHARIRHPMVRSWDTMAAANHDKALKGRGVLKALYEDEADNELAGYRKETTVGALVDLRAFYDHVDLNILLQEALELKFPLPLLLLSVEMCISPRAIFKAGSFHKGVQPVISLVAGDGRALSLARVSLHKPTLSTLALHAQAKLRQFVDDLSIKARHKQLKKAVTAAEEAITTLLALLTDMGQEISEKTELLSNSGKATKMLHQRLRRKGYHFKQATSCRDLGVDTSFGRRRVVATARKRQQEARQRAKRLSMMVNTNRRASKLYRQGVASKSLWAAHISGLPGTTAKRLRAEAARATSWGGKGTCPYTAIALECGWEADPEIRVARLQLQAWFNYLGSLDMKDRLEVAIMWPNIREHITAGASIWARARGPFGSLMSMLLAQGWWPKAPTVWEDSQRNLWQYDGSDPSEFIQHFVGDMVARNRSKASEHEGGGGMQPPLATDITHKVCKAMQKKGQFDLAGCLARVVTGGVWTEDKREREGYTKDKLCRRCGQADSLWHTYWHCKGNLDLEEQHPEVFRTTNTIQWALSNTDFECLWVRGWVPEGWFTLKSPTIGQHTPEAEIQRWDTHPDEEELFIQDGTEVASDGSGGICRDPRARKVAWGFVVCGKENEPENFGRGKFGGKAGAQTVPAAELEAIRQIALATQEGAIATVWVDHKNFADKEADKRVTSTAAPHLRRLWEEIEHILSTKQAHLKIKYVPSHLMEPAGAHKWPKAKGIPDTATLGNSVADKFAEEAASRVAVPEAIQQHLRLRGEEAKAVLYRLAIITQALAKLPRDTGRETKKVKIDRPSLFKTMMAAKRNTGHKVHLATDDKSSVWRCNRCWQQAKTGRLRSCTELFSSQCGPEGPGERPHPTHSLTRIGRGLGCNKCGATAVTRLRLLARPCLPQRGAYQRLTRQQHAAFLVLEVDDFGEALPLPASASEAGNCRVGQGDS